MKPLVVAIGASAGGVEALKQVFNNIKKPSSLAILVVLHFAKESKNLLPYLYQDISEFNIKEAEPGEAIVPETVYIAPPDYHLSAEEDYTLTLSTEEAVNFSRPSIDILMDSVATSFHKDATGILLTGANHDGAKGMAKIKKFGGLTIVQDPKEAQYPVMPESCLKIFQPDMICTLEEINHILKSSMKRFT